MPSLQELMKKYDIKPESSPASGPRGKLLYQADRMLAELDKYKTEKELNGPNTQYWWAPKSVNGKRRVTMRYGGKVVEDVTVYADNTLDSVRATVTKFKALIEESNDETWADEEARRKKK